MYWLLRVFALKGKTQLGLMKREHWHISNTLKYRMRENSLTGSITKYKNFQKSESLQPHNYRLGEQVKSVELADFSVQVKVSLFRKS